MTSRLLFGGVAWLAALLLLAVGILATLMLAAFLAYTRGRLLTRGVERLQAALETLRGPRPAVPAPDTPVSEFNAALVAAAIATPKDIVRKAESASKEN